MNEMHNDFERLLVNVFIKQVKLTGSFKPCCIIADQEVGTQNIDAQMAENENSKEK